MKLILLTIFLLLFPAFVKAQCDICEHPVQLIQNGNFSAGNTGFSTLLIPGTGFFCPLCIEGTYAVGSNAFFYHNDFIGTDHTNPPTGNFFIANGAGYPNYQVWCQTVNLQTNTDYTFSMWARDVTNNADPHPLAQLQVTFNGAVSGATLIAQGDWSQMQFIWNSGDFTSVQICIINLQDQTGGNDFGLDDISLTACHNYNIAFPADAGADKTICSNEQGNIGALSHTGYFYHWDNFNGLSSATSANPSVILENTSGETYTETYILSVDSANVGCLSTDTVQVIVIPLPPFELGPDISLCPGDSALLDAGPGWESISWQSSISGWASSESQLTVHNAATYTSTVTLNNCQIEDNVIVDIVNLPLIDLGQDYAMCSGELHVLAAPVNGVWSTGETGNQIIVTTGGDYSFVYSIDGCSSRDSISISEFNYPDVLISGEGFLCEGDAIVLTSTMTGLWNTGDFGLYTEVNQAGHYDIVVSNGPCTTTEGTDIVMIPLPFANPGDDILICEGEPVVLDAFANQNDHYVWSTGDTLTNIIIHSAGIYSVTVSNSCGEQTSEVVVDSDVCGWNIFIPNCFTPNGDGINDSWRPEGYNVNNLSVFVYNRLGDLIFSSNDLEKEWSPGDLVGDDAYNFLITGTDYYGKKFERKGHISVLR